MNNYAYILSVGNEVTSGSVINSNASIIAQNLGYIGIEVKKVITIPDDEKMIFEALSLFMASSSKVLITTGGLGPTHDDFTKEVIAKFFGLELVKNDDASSHMREYFGTDLFDSNLKQTYLPIGSIDIPNHLGTADGFILNINDKIIMSLVGPTFEMEPMFKDTCIPYLKGLGDEYLIINYTLVGASESMLENMLGSIALKYKEVSLCSYCNNAKIRFCLKAVKKDIDKFNEIKNIFEELCKDYIISNNNEEVEEVLVRILKEKKLSISFCESMTGGLLASLVTSVSGASSVLKDSFVTYDNSVKIKLLKVKKETIDEYDVVSCEVANEMVSGLAMISSSDVLVSVTGYAGPTGKDIGKVCYSIKYKGSTYSFEDHFKGSRSMIRTRASRMILYNVIRIVTNEKER